VTAGTAPLPVPAAERRTLAAPSSFGSDVAALTARAIRALLREPESFIPALAIPLFFFVVQIGALGKVAARAFGIDNYAAFQLPVAVLFASANTSGGNALVLDIDGGYWDKLSLTPVRRSAMVIGTLLGEMFSVICYSLLLTMLGLAMGVRYVGGELGGILGLLALTVLFGVGFAAVSVAVALATGSVRATQTTFVIFFPLLFLTPGTLPRSLMQGWFRDAVSVNPITYVLEAGRAFLHETGVAFNAATVSKGFIAALGFCAFTFSLTALAFRRRARMG
jgi:ABC-2 type transport system permease protein